MKAGDTVEPAEQKDTTRVSNDPTSSSYDPAPQGPLSDAERAVLDKLATYAVSMRDAAARVGADDQWSRYAHVSTVVEEVLANGWEDADTLPTDEDTDDVPPADTRTVADVLALPVFPEVFAAENQLDAESMASPQFQATLRDEIRQLDRPRSAPRGRDNS